MVLKEAYTYQNYLKKLVQQAMVIVSNKGFVTTTTETHNRTKVNSEAENEVKVQKKSFDYEFTPQDLINFLAKALTEKEKLSNAIEAAKEQVKLIHGLDVDVSISTNKEKQSFITILDLLANEVKPSELEKTGTDYKFDVNMQQCRYSYPITSVTTIDYDRNNVRNLLKKYQKETDNISLKLDQIELTTDVDYTPLPGWERGAKLEEVVSV